MLKPSTVGDAVVNLTTAVIGASQFNDSLLLTSLAAATIGFSLWSLSALLSRQCQPIDGVPCPKASRAKPACNAVAPRLGGTAEAPEGPSRHAMIAWLMYDWASNAFPTIIQTFLFASYFTGQVAGTETAGTSWWGIAVGAAGVVVALGGPILGALCDQLGRRKPWIAGFTWLAAAVAALMWFIEPSSAYVVPALVLVFIGVIGSELALVLYNAMLPTLVRPDRIGRWSGWGWGAGYLGGLACLALALFVFVRPEGAWLGLDAVRWQHVRATFPMTGIWFFVFSLPLFFWTPDVPSTGKSLRRAVGDAFAQLEESLRGIRDYLPIARFLVARMLYANGLATIFTFGGIYAGGTFEMGPREEWHLRIPNLFRALAFGSFHGVRGGACMFSVCV